MPTVIHNEADPGSSEQASGGNNAIAIVLLVIVVIALLFYGLPRLGMGGGGSTAPAPENPGDTNIQEAPEVNQEAPDVNIPDQIDVNINQEGQEE